MNNEFNASLSVFNDKGVCLGGQSLCLSPFRVLQYSGYNIVNNPIHCRCGMTVALLSLFTAVLSEIRGPDDLFYIYIYLLSSHNRTSIMELSWLSEGGGGGGGYVAYVNACFKLFNI